MMPLQSDEISRYMTHLLNHGFKMAASDFERVGYRPGRGGARWVTGIGGGPPPTVTTCMGVGGPCPPAPPTDRNTHASTELLMKTIGITNKSDQLRCT
jgi:hypothetical protein